MKLDQVRNAGDYLGVFDRDSSFKGERMGLKNIVYMIRYIIYLYDIQISELMYKVVQKNKLEEKGEIQ